MNCFRLRRRFRTIGRAASLASALLLTGTLHAEARYVYHDRSSDDITDGAESTTCGDSVANAAPLRPAAGQVEVVSFQIEHVFLTDEAWLYFTTDGSAPSASMGVPFGTTQVVSASYLCRFTPPGRWANDIAQAVITEQPAGTSMRYIVSARHTVGGQEIFANSGTCDNCVACVEASCATVFEYSVQNSSDASVLDGQEARDDASASDTAQPDTNTPDSAQIWQDTSTHDLGRSDLTSGDAVSASDSGPSDTSLPDDAATATDTASGIDQSVVGDVTTVGDQGTTDRARSDVPPPATEPSDQSSCTCRGQTAGPPVCLACWTLLLGHARWRLRRPSLGNVDGLGAGSQPLRERLRQVVDAKSLRREYLMTGWSRRLSTERHLIRGPERRAACCPAAGAKRGFEIR